MSNFVKTAVLAGTFGLMSIASAFAQNKSDIKIAPNLKAAPGFKTEIQKLDDGVIAVSYSSQEGKFSSNLKLIGEDKNKNQILEQNEIYAVDYKENFENDGISTELTLSGPVNEAGIVEQPTETTRVTIDGRTEAFKDNAEDTHLSALKKVTQIVPGIQKATR